MVVPKRWVWGRGLMIISALTYGVLPATIDLIDPEHMSNPAWPPHSRLHLMWLISMGLFLSLYTIVLVWRATLSSPRGVYTGAIIGACQVGGFYTAGLAAPFIGAAFDAGNRTLFGFLPPALLHFLISGLLLMIGFLLARRALKQAMNSQHPDAKTT